MRNYDGSGELDKPAPWQNKRVRIVIINSGVKSIGKDAFFGCKDLEAVDIGTGVNHISSGAFAQCENLKSIRIPDNVVTMGEGVFLQCPKLSHVMLSGKLQVLRLATFMDCKSIETVTLPEGLTTIENLAFDGCTNLKTVTLPSTISSIGKDAFAHCPNLTSIKVDTLNTNYCDIDGVLYDKTGTKLIRYPEGKQTGFSLYLLPQYVTSIAPDAFAGCKQFNQIIHRQEIDWSNAGVSSSIKITHMVTSGYCGEHLSWNFDESTSSLTIAGYGDMYDYPGDEFRNLPWYLYLQDIKSISLPEGLTSIGDNAFSFCSKIRSITIPNTVKKIGESSFQSCYSLEQISIPNSVTSIGAYAFAIDSSLVSVTLSENLTKLDTALFKHCVSMRSITIPKSVKTIGVMAFSECSALRYVTLPHSLISIGDFAFSDCSALQSITIPNSVASIGKFAFDSDSSLVSVTLSENLTKLDTSLFRHCVAMQSIIIPQKVKTIEAWVFVDCVSLSSITIPSSVKSIGDRAFFNCKTMQSVFISKEVVKMAINSTAFDNCDALQHCIVPERLELPTSITQNRQVIRIPVELPDLQIVENSLYLSDANGNNTIEVDEPCYIHFKLCNKGKGDGKGCVVNITGQQDYSFIHVVPDTTIGDVAAFDTINVTIPIGTTHNAGTENVLITISVKDIQEVETNSAFITLHTSRFVKPSITIKSFELYSYSSIAAKAIPISVRMNIQNQSIGFAKDVKCEIQLPEGCLVTKGEIAHQWETLSPGENQNISFDFVPTKSASNSIEIQYLLMEKYGKYGESGAIPITFGKTPTYRITSSEDKSLSIAGNPKIKMLINTSVAILRPEWFNKYNTPQNVKSPFPYAAIKLELKGTKEAIDIAKERLSLMMGRKHIVEAKDVKETNMIWFLVHCRNEYIDLDCGDGCEPINIRKERLEPNNVYHGIVDVNVL